MCPVSNEARAATLRAWIRTAWRVFDPAIFPLRSAAPSGRHLAVLLALVVAGLQTGAFLLGL
jgi:hypothetical protein